MSPHQVGLLDILDLCRIRETAPLLTEMITVVPEDLSVAIGLTPTLEAKLSEVMALLQSSLADYNTVVQGQGRHARCMNSPWPRD